MPRDKLPAYSTLRAFVAAARRESVRAAADELGVTPSAVSHQIRVLEGWVGQPLFLRAGRQIQLTAQGRKLFRRLNAGFDAIETAAKTARAAARDGSLRISALPLITSSWLVPRLQNFEELCAKERGESSSRSIPATRSPISRPTTSTWQYGAPIDRQPTSS